MQISSKLLGLEHLSRATDSLAASVLLGSAAPVTTLAPTQGPGFTTNIRMVEKPAPFTGYKADAAALGAFFVSVKQYFYVCGITNPVQMGSIAVMWLHGNA